MARLFYILVLLIAALPTILFAASFDCAKASITQEKMICNDSTLSSLDDKLMQTYKSAIAATQSTEIQKQQKEWLKNTRDNCTSKPCLVEIYEKRISELSQHAQTPNTDSCPASEQTLVGAWQSVSGGFFQEMAFEYSGTEKVFNSWLHERPEISDGSWKIENCTLFIQHRTEEDMGFAFTIVKVDKDRLYLFDSSDGSKAVYQRIK